MKRFLFVVLAGLCLPLSAQKQQSLGRWKIPSANYSGLARLGGNQYALVDDKANYLGWLQVELVFTPKGKLEKAQVLKRVGQTGQRDQEGITFNPLSQTLFIAAESDQRILEYRLDGTPTGRELQVPAYAGLSHIQPNLGFESLSYNAITDSYWTVTENALKSDESGLLHLLKFDGNLHFVEDFPYRLDAPECTKKARSHAHGVSELLAMDDGSLYVLEREFYVAPHYLGSFVSHKLYHVVPGQKKQWVTQFKTRLDFFHRNLANYEGMCQGPAVQGHPTILLLSDSQNGYGNALFHLKDYVRLILL